jgi:hypothetical protein
MEYPIRFKYRLIWQLPISTAAGDSDALPPLKQNILNPPDL